MTSPDDYLTTTQAAALLGCSRQHIVHLCDIGQLPHTRRGTHRRIRRSDVDRLLSPPLRREDERSLWFLFVRVDPRLSDLRRDPRFTALVQRVGFPP